MWHDTFGEIVSDTPLGHFRNSPIYRASEISPHCFTQYTSVAPYEMAFRSTRNSLSERNMIIWALWWVKSFMWPIHRKVPKPSFVWALDTWLLSFDFCLNQWICSAIKNDLFQLILSYVWFIIYQGTFLVLCWSNSVRYSSRNRERKITLFWLHVLRFTRLTLRKAFSGSCSRSDPATIHF